MEILADFESLVNYASITQLKNLEYSYKDMNFANHTVMTNFNNKIKCRKNDVAISKRHLNISKNVLAGFHVSSEETQVLCV